MAQSQDSVGNIYNGLFEQFLSAQEGITTFSLHQNAKSIFGESENSYAFRKCSSTLNIVTFPINSQLNTISKFAFYQCTKIQEIDLSKCAHLETIEDKAFSSCSQLSSITFPPSLLTLGKYTFDSVNLLSVFIPKSVSTISTGCFSSCKNLQSVEFETGIDIKSLPDYTFEHCGLLSFSIPQSVTYFTSFTLWGCVSLTKLKADNNAKFEVVDNVLLTKDGKKLIFYPASLTLDAFTLPEGIETISMYSLYRSKSQEIVLPKSLKKIDKNAFYQSEIQRITIPDNVTVLGAEVFSSCHKLTSVTLSSSLTSLSYGLFMYSGIESIIIHENITSIGGSCFLGCSELGSITIPSGVTKIEGGVFSKCPKIEIHFADGSPFSIDSQLLIKSSDGSTIVQFIGETPSTTVDVTSGIKIIKSSSFSGNLNLIGLRFETDELTIIEEQAFKDCTNLKNLVFPSSLTRIDKLAFYNTSLSEVKLGPNLQVVDNTCFGYCRKLVKATFVDSNLISSQKFGSSIFENCNILSSIKLCNKTTTIGFRFAMCSAIENIVFPTALNSIGKEAFSYTELKTVTFENSATSLTSIPDKAFYSSKELYSFEFCNGIETINVSAFSFTALQEVRLPASVTTIGEGCFSSCSNLKVFCSNESTTNLKEIGIGALEKCPNLELINFTNDYFKTSNGVLYSSDLQRLVIFPAASRIHFVCLPTEVTMIGPSAFHSCNNIYTVTIPDDSRLMSFGPNSFSQCTNLRVINIPESVNTVGLNSFDGCKSLSCGIVIGNQDKEFLAELVSIGKMPKRCLMSCVDFHSRVDCRFNHLSIFLLGCTFLLN